MATQVPIPSRDGSDELTGIEVLVFQDKEVELEAARDTN